MIKINNLTKVYGDKRGVENINFTINKGEVVGLLGSNGAGKSTIMNMLAGYLTPTSGSIEIDECDVVQNPSAVGNKLGFLPEIPPLYVEMTVERYLTFLAEIRNIKKSAKKNHVKEIMELTNISSVKERLIRNLSKGYRQRVGLAQALIGNPQVLILDEPTVGLDPRQIKEVRNLILKLSENHTIILSSHILSEIKMTCKRVIIINEGKLLADETMENIEKGEHNRYIIQAKCSFDEAKTILNDIMENFTELKKEEDYYCKFSGKIANTKTGRENIISTLTAKNISVIEFKPAIKTLEETFITLTSQKTKEEEQ